MLPYAPAVTPDTVNEFAVTELSGGTNTPVVTCLYVTTTLFATLEGAPENMIHQMDFAERC